MDFPRKYVSVYLIIISTISLSLQLYHVDFSLPIFSDNLDLTLRAFAHLQGNFEMSPNRNFGWPLFISPFLLLVDSNDFIDYSNLVRILSMSIVTFTILPMYLLSRKFFDKKYSLMTASLLAFEPNLARDAGLGLTEPLFTLILIGSFYFIINNNNNKYLYFSFLLGGISYWVRPMGLVMFFVLSVIYLLIFRKSVNLMKYCICVGIFLLAISPVLILRYEQFGYPFYYDSIAGGFVDETSMLFADNVSYVSASEYIQKNGIITFIDNFILNGIYNIFTALAKVSLPYLIFMIPVGAILTLVISDQNKRYFLANWILILASLISLVIVFAIIVEIRFLFPLIPFLIIFATFAIKRITEFKWNPFSKSEQKKKIFLLLVLAFVISSSAVFTLYRWDKTDMIRENEEIEFAKYLKNNLKGKIFDDSRVTDYFSYVRIVDNTAFKTWYLTSNKQNQLMLPSLDNLEKVQIHGDSLDEIISEGEKLGLTHIVFNGDGQLFYKFLNNVYYDEDKYPFLIKVFDSEKEGYKKLKVKVFKIDYEKFHKVIKVKNL